MAEWVFGSITTSRRRHRQTTPSPHHASDIEMIELNPRWKTALKQNHQRLRTELIIWLILPTFYEFLSEVEFERVKGSPSANNVVQVDNLIEILLTKEERRFTQFLIALWKNGYEDTAERLAEEAGGQVNWRIASNCLSYESVYAVLAAIIQAKTSAVPVQLVLEQAKRQPLRKNRLF